MSPRRGVVCVLAALVACATGAVSFAQGEILARWRDGSLSRQDYLARHDPGARTLAGDEQAVRIALAKAVYLEMLLSAARAAELEASAGFRQRLADHTVPRPSELDALLGVSEPDAARVLALAAELPARKRLSFDLAVLRCPMSRESRQQCAPEAEALAVRFAEVDDAAQLDGEMVKAGRWQDVEADKLDPLLSAAIESLQPGGVTRAETLAGPAIVRLLAREEEPDLTVARERLLSQARADAWSKLRSRSTAAEPLDDQALLAAAYPERALRDDPDRIDRYDWLLADYAFEVLPGFAPEPSPQDLAAARERLAHRRIRTWVLSSAEGTDRLFRLAEAVLAEAGVEASLPAGLAPSEVLLSSREVARLPRAFAQRVSGTSGWMGPLALPMDVANHFGAGCTRACLAVIRVERVDPADADAVLREARRHARGQIGSSLSYWWELFGRRFEIVLLPGSEA